MITRLYKYERPYGWLSDIKTSYWAIEFADDQSYYQAVTYMRDKHGRAGSHREKTPYWTHNPNDLTIGLRWNGDAIAFLTSQYGWKELHLRLSSYGTADDSEVEEWCAPRNYLYWTTYKGIGVCVPTEKELLFTKLRFSNNAMTEPVF